MIGGSVFSCLDRGFLLPPVCLFRSLLHTSQRGVGVQEGNGQGYCNWIKLAPKTIYFFFCLEAGKKGYWVSSYRAFGFAAILVGQEGYIRRAL